MVILKRICFILLLTILSHSVLTAQLNMSLVGNLSYNTDLNDIWGYTDSNGKEYAIVGLKNGVSVVDLSIPSAPVQVGFAPGVNSTWRDIKVWGNYAYVTADQGNDGLMIVDLSNLPTSATYTFYRPELTVMSGTDTLNTAHNIWIDENGDTIIGENGLKYQPPAIDFIGAADACAYEVTYTAIINSVCGNQSCTSTIRLDNDQLISTKVVIAN